MLEQSAHKYLSRLLLTYSDLCSTDAEIAACLTFMHITPPANEPLWTAEVVRRLMPEAYSTVCTTSDYATNPPNQAATAYCTAVYGIIKAREGK
jgi:hypothetical protein